MFFVAGVREAHASVVLSADFAISLGKLSAGKWTGGGSPVPPRLGGASNLVVRWVAWSLMARGAVRYWGLRVKRHRDEVDDVVEGGGEARDRALLLGEMFVVGEEGGEPGAVQCLEQEVALELSPLLLRVEGGEYLEVLVHEEVDLLTLLRDVTREVQV